MPSAKLTKTDIQRLLALLEEDLAAHDAMGELYLVGGAVMSLAFDARDSTKYVDALFKPARLVREAASRVGAKMGLDETWLNAAPLPSSYEVRCHAARRRVRGSG